MDKHTPEQRRKNMQAVKNKDSEIEVLLRKELWSRGLRYQKIQKKYSENLTLFLLARKSLFFVTVNFGMDTTGKNEKTTLNPIKNFGYPKLNGI